MDENFIGISGNPVALPQIGDAPKTSAQRVVTTTTTRRPPPTQAPARTTTSSSRRQPASQIQPDPDDLSPEELVNLHQKLLKCSICSI